jgi:hypothetical protein
VRAILRGVRDGRAITHRTASDDFVLGYEGIIGGQKRPLASRGHIRGGVLAVKDASDEL